MARRRWLDEQAFADLVALCQFLPGPASSQVGMALGIGRAGVPGAVAAWVGFTAPSAMAMILFAYGAQAWSGTLQGGVLHGLKVVAVAVVALAVLGYLYYDRSRTPVVKIDVPGFSGEITRDKKGVDIEVDRN